MSWKTQTPREHRKFLMSNLVVIDTLHVFGAEFWSGFGVCDPKINYRTLSDEFILYNEFLISRVHFKCSNFIFITCWTTIRACQDFARARVTPRPKTSTTEDSSFTQCEKGRIPPERLLKFECSNRDCT